MSEEVIYIGLIYLLFMGILIPTTIYFYKNRRNQLDLRFGFFLGIMIALTLIVVAIEGGIIEQDLMAR